MFAQIIDNKIVGLFTLPQAGLENIVEIAENDSRIAEFYAPSLIQQIIRLEETITPRRIREAILGNSESVAFIEGIDAEISALRAQL